MQPGTPPDWLCMGQVLKKASVLGLSLLSYHALQLQTHSTVNTDHESWLQLNQSQ